MYVAIRKNPYATQKSQKNMYIYKKSIRALVALAAVLFRQKSNPVLPVGSGNPVASVCW